MVSGPKCLVEGRLEHPAHPDSNEIRADVDIVRRRKQIVPLARVVVRIENPWKLTAVHSQGLTSEEDSSHYLPDALVVNPAKGWREKEPLPDSRAHSRASRVKRIGNDASSVRSRRLFARRDKRNPRPGPITSPWKPMKLAVRSILYKS